MKWRVENEKWRMKWRVINDKGKIMGGYYVRNLFMK